MCICTAVNDFLTRFHAQSYFLFNCVLGESDSKRWFHCIQRLAEALQHQASRVCGESTEVPQNIVDDWVKQLAALTEVASGHISSKSQDLDDERAVL